MNAVDIKGCEPCSLDIFADKSPYTRCESIMKSTDVTPVTEKCNIVQHILGYEEMALFCVLIVKDRV